MRVLILGSGAREHAMCWAIAQSPLLDRLYCAPGNGGTSTYAEPVALNLLDSEQCAQWAEQHAIDLTIVGPEEPLTCGIVDTFLQRGQPIFGPSRAAARIERSKIWAKDLMARAGIPTAQARGFHDQAGAER